MLQENMKELSELNIFKPRKQQILLQYFSEKSFKCSEVNRTLPSLHGGSIEAMLSVPLLLQ